MSENCVVIWDFDGTLVDSRRKNLNVARAIIEDVTDSPADTYEVLASIEKYQTAETLSANWRDFYSREFGMSESEIDHAGSFWTAYQLRDTTPTPVFAGIPEAIVDLRHFPQGIVSQNGKKAITKALKAIELHRYFKAVVGYEEVGLKRQKPAPDGLLSCLEMLCDAPVGFLFYVGDHETDILCATRAKEALHQHQMAIKVVPIAACYGGASTSSWKVQPSHVAAKPEDVVRIVTSYLD